MLLNETTEDTFKRVEATNFKEAFDETKAFFAEEKQFIEDIVGLEDDRNERLKSRKELNEELEDLAAKEFVDLEQRLLKIDEEVEGLRKRNEEIEGGRTA